MLDELVRKQAAELKVVNDKLSAIREVLDDAAAFGDEVDPGDIRKILEA